MKILIQNKITQNRYKKVLQIMSKIGSPIIECIQISENYYYALEGSHRITAAKQLGIKPILSVITDLEGWEDDNELYRIYFDSKSREAKKLFVEFEE